MSDIISIFNQSGGPGKTTLTLNLAAAFAEMGEKVLAVDLDPQGHLTGSLGKEEYYLQETPNLYDCLVDGKIDKVNDLIYPLRNEKFSLLPSNYKMMLVEQSLYLLRNREHRLIKVLGKIKGHFDLILLD